MANANKNKYKRVNSSTSFGMLVQDKYHSGKISNNIAGIIKTKVSQIVCCKIIPADTKRFAP